MAKKKTKKKRHYCDGNVCYHGAFNTKAKAVAKERETPESFIVKKLARFGRQLTTRFLVLTKDKSGVPF